MIVDRLGTGSVVITACTAIIRHVHGRLAAVGRGHRCDNGQRVPGTRVLRSRRPAAGDHVRDVRLRGCRGPRGRAAYGHRHRRTPWYRFRKFCILILIPLYHSRPVAVTDITPRVSIRVRIVILRGWYRRNIEI